MTRAGLVERLLWTAVACASAGTVVTLQRRERLDDVPPSAIPSRPRVDPTMAVESLAVLATTLSAHDPFRISHQPPTVSFGGGSELSPPPASARPRPMPILQGLIGRATRWEAVLAGIPGHDGSVVVRVGDTLAGLRIRRIDRDTVVVVAADTAWKLTLRPGSP
jgi:hypothetical protein